ncbi:MAG: VIT and VWA domain-containing protein [Bryobacteraceae bacterium]|jgi:Ca-activated chloride channel family protein
MKCATATVLGLICTALAWCDTGVLTPGDRQEPDPSVISLNEMSIEVRIDNGVARVRIRQIFGNHTANIQEGAYHFALPANAAISDFAVWDDVTRIPGVILERRRAGEIYDVAKAQAIDPGLLQMGERDADEARRSAEFTARIVPIPAWGTKRLEIEYQHPIAVERYRSEFVVPLKPDVYAMQTARHLTVVFELHSDHAIRDFEPLAKSYPLKIEERSPNRIRAVFYAYDVALKEDLAIRYSFDDAQADALKVSAERESPAEPGFFRADTLLRVDKKEAQPQTAPPRTVVLLFDNSLSMQWDKLERSFVAFETALRRLRPTDSFNVLLFNSDVTPFAPKPETASSANIEGALAFVRRSDIRAGTNLQRVLGLALSQAAEATAGERYVMLIGDGGATEGTVRNSTLASWFSEHWRKAPPAARPHMFVFGVGDDANVPLLSALAANGGVFEQVRSTEPVDFKLNAFLDKIGREPVKNLSFAAAPAGNFDLVYPLEDVHFPGSMASWVGEYKRPSPKAAFTVTGIRAGQAVRIAASTSLPAQATDNPMLPRTWAKARVDALLAKIERDGEDRATVDEIIRLSKKYKFVTPYTSFLAVPRALLRPRVIRPGDPVLRVKTDESIISVIALFPFGLVKPLRYLKAEDTWQTRFLSPEDMADGTYRVRLILRDRSGNVYREAKSFVIASRMPTVRVKLDKPRVRRGETLRVSAYASSNTRTITARLYGTMPVALHWNGTAKADTGDLIIPADVPPGKYTLHVMAEDVAHNIGTQEVALEIW